MITFMVKDTGRGISMEQLNKIFMLFELSENSNIDELLNQNNKCNV